MPIYRASNDGGMERQEPVDAAGIDARLAEWMDTYPWLLLEREPLALIGSPQDGGPILAVDQRGSVVVVRRLYSDDAPALIGATLAEAARIDGMTFETLDEMVARTSAARTGVRRGLREVYRDAFIGERIDPAPALDRVAFNAKQRIVFVATAFTPQCERTLRYLRYGCGADVYGVQIGVYGLRGELTIETRVVVGFDGPPKEPSPRGHQLGLSAAPAAEPLDEAAVVEAAILLLRRPAKNDAQRDERASGDLHDGLMAA